MPASGQCGPADQPGSPPPAAGTAARVGHPARDTFMRPHWDVRAAFSAQAADHRAAGITVHRKDRFPIAIPRDWNRLPSSQHPSMAALLAGAAIGYAQGI